MTSSLTILAILESFLSDAQTALTTMVCPAAHQGQIPAAIPIHQIRPDVLTRDHQVLFLLLLRPNGTQILLIIQPAIRPMLRFAMSSVHHLVMEAAYSLNTWALDLQIKRR